MADFLELRLRRHPMRLASEGVPPRVGRAGLERLAASKAMPVIRVVERSGADARDA